MERTLRSGEIPFTTVRCVHATECAGCPLIHLDYAQQLTQKRARVVTAMSHYPALELLYTRPVNHAEPMVGYRGRAKTLAQMVLTAHLPRAVHDVVYTRRTAGMGGLGIPRLIASGRRALAATAAGARSVSG